MAASGRRQVRRRPCLRCGGRAARQPPRAATFDLSLPRALAGLPAVACRYRPGQRCRNPETRRSGPHEHRAAPASARCSRSSSFGAAAQRLAFAGVGRHADRVRPRPRRRRLTQTRLRSPASSSPPAASAAGADAVRRPRELRQRHALLADGRPVVSRYALQDSCWRWACCGPRWRFSHASSTCWRAVTSRRAPIGVDVAQTPGWHLSRHGPLATAVAVTTTGRRSASSASSLPHLVRLAIGNDQRVLLPAAALAGGILLTWRPTRWRARSSRRGSCWSAC